MGYHVEFQELSRESVGHTFEYTYVDQETRMIASEGDAVFPVAARYHTLKRIEYFKVRELRIVYADIECCTAGKTREFSMPYQKSERKRTHREVEYRTITTEAGPHAFLRTDPMFVESTWESMQPWWQDLMEPDDPTYLLRQIERGNAIKDDDFTPYPYQIEPYETF